MGQDSSGPARSSCQLCPAPPSWLLRWHDAPALLGRVSPGGSHAGPRLAEKGGGWGWVCLLCLEASRPLACTRVTFSGVPLHPGGLAVRSSRPHAELSGRDRLQRLVPNPRCHRSACTPAGTPGEGAWETPAQPYRASWPGPGRLQSFHSRAGYYTPPLHADPRIVQHEGPATRPSSTGTPGRLSPATGPYPVSPPWSPFALHTNRPAGF